MFNLEPSINEWRRRMLADGIRGPEPLGELESHLREDVEEKLRSGMGPHEAFEAAIQEIGQTGALKTEFAIAGDTVYEQAKQFLGHLLKLPNYQLATTMNTMNQTGEPRWASYLKTTAFALPALVLWVGSLVFVLPKLKEICLVSHTVLPEPMLFTLAISDFLKNNLLVTLMFMGLTLVLLEWRSHWWKRRRRMALGIAAFVLNSSILMFFFFMFILAVLAGSNLLPHHL
jgi:hypothetical protein